MVQFPMVSTIICGGGIEIHITLAFIRQDIRNTWTPTPLNVMRSALYLGYRTAPA